MSTRSRARALARLHGLGAVGRVHREHLRVWTPWARYTAVLAGAAVLGCALRDPGLAVAIMAATTVLVYGHAHFSEIAEPVGRRRVAVCAGGLLVLSEFADPVVLRWTGVDLTLTVPRRRGHRADAGVCWTETVYYEGYQVMGHDIAGRPVTVPIGPFTDRRSLVAAIEAAAAPVVLARARTALAARGRAEFGPVAVTPSGLELTVGEAMFVAPWSKFHTGAARLTPLLPRAVHDHPQLAQTPVSRALLALIAETRPPRVSNGDGR
ncbi:hypothetical protein AB0I28_07925 [Phytomonospora sp. NPDC050363]|uniref:hypothetical protein n=1 Tax=Phytomonospora sp. NPDC050363 TaxID=3155642 RepID=UPI0033DD9CA3